MNLWYYLHTLKINSIRISNILSFEHKDDLNDCEKITFDEGLNILIGPNGAGKSNFLEILNQIFTHLFFRQCIFKEEQLQLNRQDAGQHPLNRTIEHPGFPPTALRQNNKTPTQPMRIRIEILISEPDIENLRFIQTNVDELHRIGQRYCTNNPLTPAIMNHAIFSHRFIASFDIVIDPSGNLAVEGPRTANPLLGAIQIYLHWFEYVQKLITIGILWEGHNDWIPLKNSFATISGYRNYNAIGTNYSISQGTKSSQLIKIREKITQDSIRKSSMEEPIVFEYVRHYLAFEYEKIRNDVADHPQGIPAKEVLNQNPIFRGINDALEKTLKIQLDIDKDELSPNYLFSFVNGNGSIIQNSELSAGEKGIIHFIFSLYGFDLENGMMIIDEPELHIHPQIQQKYVQIINQVLSDLQLQFIIATHSPIFVNPDTIDGVIRFYKNDEDFTKTKKHGNITKDVKDRIQMLNYINAAKIFFADKVVLVEGPADNYFYRHYLQNFIERYSRDIPDVEFLNMDGAQRYEKWFELLNDFKIKNYYIGDFDNVKQDSISPNGSQWKSRYPDKLLHQKIEQVKQATPTDYQSMLNEILAAYSKNIFLLQQGSLEDYMEIITNTRGNPERVLNFLNNTFENWIQSNNNMDVKNELDYFFHMISRNKLI